MQKLANRSGMGGKLVLGLREVGPRVDIGAVANLTNHRARRHGQGSG